MKDEWDIQEILLSIFITPIYWLYLAIRGIFAFLWKLVKDVAKHIYGKVVIALGTLGFVLLVTYLSHFFR